MEVNECDFAESRYLKAPLSKKPKWNSKAYATSIHCTFLG
jgi:hypothetical protein